eukprot:GHVH01012322.1.p1 GENE.GHVH01012322.1~~GHVH01012322.1.p1  ORF type:complete len:615 (+),score=65.03 GHVH01012322.1:117-1961(+)
MKGIVSSVKRRVFGKDGEEIITANGASLPVTTIPIEVSHNVPHSPVRDASSSPQNAKVNSPSASPIAPCPKPSESHSRREKLRGRVQSTGDVRKDHRERSGSKGRRDDNSNHQRKESGDANSGGVVVKLADKVDDPVDRAKKTRKEFANHSAAFTGGLFSVPMDQTEFKQGLLPGSSPSADPAIFEALPQLRDVTAAPDREKLFRQKVQACGSVIFDLDQSNFANEKEAKKSTLVELVDYLQNTRNPINDVTFPEVLHMIGVNLFRDLPGNRNFVLHHFQTVEDEERQDAQWPHRQPIYEFFMRFILASEIEVKVVRQHINQSFILRLLDLFQTDDPREREYLKSLLHRIYGKVMSLRQFIRRSIQSVFHRFIEGYGRPYGIAELLEILGSIINGFAIPLKAEHKVMLEKSFIPLHNSWAYNLFQNQLQYCMVQYVLKEPALVETIIMGMLRFWPVANTQKELSFITEVEEIVGEILNNHAEFERIKIPLFSRLAECIQSSHFQVAERVLFLWHPNCVISPLVDEHRLDIFPLLIGPLYSNSVSHWNGVVHQLTYQVSKLMSEKEPRMFERYNADTEMNKEAIDKAEAERLECWSALELAVKPNKTPAITNQNY